MPYRAQTKGKVERLNHYLKTHFYIPLKSSFKGSGIAITHQSLNDHIFRWLAHANSRVHAITNKRPKDMLKNELSSLSPVYSNMKCNQSLDVAHNNYDNNDNTHSFANIDIVYTTTLSDYEQVLGDEYAQN